jgi:hypothetical protein
MKRPKKRLHGRKYNQRRLSTEETGSNGGRNLSFYAFRLKTARMTHYNRVNRNRDHKEAVENPLGRPMFATALPEAYSDIL